MLKKAFANSLEELTRIVLEGTYWNEVEFLEGGAIKNKRGIISWAHWTCKRGRYKFYTDL